MKVFLLTDLEGISGVTDIGQMERGSDAYKEACSYLTDSINLAVDTCFRAGADVVYYLDGHGGGGNVNAEAVDPRAIKCDIARWQQLLKEGSIDCQIELGSHARAGTIGGFLDHTISSRQWFCHTVNGREMSELSLHALLCSQYNVPIIACIGDETACRQAREYIPDITTGAVKRALCRNQAVSYENADEILVETIANALAHYRDTSLFRMTEPAVVELTFYRTDMCEEALGGCDNSVQRVNARTLRKTVSRITRYEDLKF